MVKDQDFKWFNYSGTQTGQVGVTGGYLQGSDPGLIGPDRFVGPRSVAIDGSGNIYTAENCLPGVAQSVWQTPGPCAIITEYQSNGTPSSGVTSTQTPSAEPASRPMTAAGSSTATSSLPVTHPATTNRMPLPSIHGHTLLILVSVVRPK